MNVFGAEKVADYLGGVLSTYTTDRRNDPVYASVWDKKVRAYNQLKATQEQEIANDGKIETYTY